MHNVVKWKSNPKRRCIFLLEQKIVDLRNQLNTMMINDSEYEKIYAISIELDKLIVEYYKRKQIRQIN